MCLAKELCAHSKQLHALAQRADHGDMDITTLASSLHRILLDPKSKEKTPA